MDNESGFIRLTQSTSQANSLTLTYLFTLLFTDRAVGAHYYLSTWELQWSVTRPATMPSWLVA